MKFIVTFFLSLHTLTSLAVSDSLVYILEKELQREYKGLSTTTIPPYYMAFRVTEVQDFQVLANMGNIESIRNNHHRVFTPEIRVGSFDLDNSREFQDGTEGLYVNTTRKDFLPLENNPMLIQKKIWNTVDRVYKVAVNRLEKIEANSQVSVQREDKSPDFTPITKKERYLEKKIPFSFDTIELKNKAKKYSELLRNNTDIVVGNVSIVYSMERKYFVSSEGTSVVYNLPRAYISVKASVKAEDGMEMSLSKTYFAYNPKDFPSNDIVESDIRKISSNLTALLSAPLVEPYSGPVILSPAAAGVFFHEIFGHRVEGLRLKNQNDGQTFKSKIGQLVLPSHFTVKSLPRLQHFENNALNGYYPYDDEGVASCDVTVVQNGILKNFLMTRSAIEGFTTSNGHARAIDGLLPVSRQSNLVIETSKPKTDEELRKLLIEEIRRQGKTYGYYFAEVSGGFTATSALSPNAFNVTPTLVYRVYADGRADELVRGVNLVGTPLAMFSQITEAGNKTEIFTGTCGAESGGIPVTAISPSLLVTRIELQKKPKNSTLKPILSRPN